MESMDKAIVIQALRNVFEKRILSMSSKYLPRSAQAREMDMQLKRLHARFNKTSERSDG